MFDGRTRRASGRSEWFHENGPVTPGLLDHLRAHGSTYDLVLFWTFRYFPSYFGLPLVADRAGAGADGRRRSRRSISTSPASTSSVPAGYLFLTPEEEALVSTRAGRAAPSVGGDRHGPRPAASEGGRARRARSTHGFRPITCSISGASIATRGATRCSSTSTEYAGAAPTPTLVLAGPAKMRVPDHPRIRALGYVSDDLREALLAQAMRADRAVTISRACSIVLLEAWNHARAGARERALPRAARTGDAEPTAGCTTDPRREFHEALACLLDTAPRSAMRLDGRDWPMSSASIGGPLFLRESRSCWTTSWQAAVIPTFHAVRQVSVPRGLPDSAFEFGGEIAWRLQPRRLIELQPLRGRILRGPLLMHDKSGMTFEFGGAIAWRPTLNTSSTAG